MRIMTKFGAGRIIQFLDEYQIDGDMMKYFIYNKTNSVRNSKIIFQFLKDRLGNIEDVISSFNYKHNDISIFWFKDHDVYLRFKHSYEWIEVVGEKFELMNFKDKKSEEEPEPTSLVGLIDDDLPF